MRNICNLILDSIFAKKVKVHYFEPKIMNLNFDKSITNDFKIINLKNINYVEFKIEEVPSDSIKLFRLMAEINFNNSNETKEIHLGKFSSEQDAKNALREIRVKSYMSIKSIYTGAIFIVLGLILVSTLQGFIKNIDIDSIKQISINQVEMNKPVNNNTTSMSEADLKLIFEKAQMEQMKKDIIQNNQGIQKIEEQPIEINKQENLSPSDLLLNNLK